MKITKRQLKRIIKEAQWGNFTGGAAPLDEPPMDSGPMTPEMQQRVFDILVDSGSDPQELRASGDYPDLTLDEADGSTEKYDDDSALRGGQSKLHDKLQKAIIDKTVEDREEHEEEQKEEKNESVRMTKRQLKRIIKEEYVKFLKEGGDWEPGWEANDQENWENEQAHQMGWYSNDHETLADRKYADAQEQDEAWDAYDTGVAAALDELDITENPYEEGSHLYDQWNDGWESEVGNLEPEEFEDWEDQNPPRR